MKKLLKKRKGFTLLETAIVLFIISLLMLLILPNLNKQRESAVNTHTTAMVSTVQSQISLYQNDNPGDSDVTLADLQNGGYLTDAQITKVNQLGITITNNTAQR